MCVGCGASSKVASNVFGCVVVARTPLSFFRERPTFYSSERISYNNVRRTGMVWYGIDQSSTQDYVTVATPKNSCLLSHKPPPPHL